MLIALLETCISGIYEIAYVAKMKSIKVSVYLCCILRTAFTNFNGSVQRQLFIML